MKTHSKKHRASSYDISGDFEKIQHAFTKTAKDVKGKATEVLNQSMDDVKDRSADLKDKCETYLSERPFKTLIVSLLSGALLSRLMRGKKRRH